MAAATSDAPRRSFLGTGEQVSWYFYDWANSAFSTTVVAVFMGPYLTSVTRAAADAEGFVHPLASAFAKMPSSLLWSRFPCCFRC